MRPLEYLRKKAFWGLDAVRGGKIKRYYDAISAIEGGTGFSETELAEYHRLKISELLKHCTETVPAYSGLNTESLEQWPVINKMVLKEGGDKYFSTAFEREQLIPMSTSGSTGTPFTCWQNPDKKRHVNAEVLFYNGKIGFEIGRKIIYFRSVVSEVQKSRLQQFMQNIDLIDCNNLSDDAIRTKLSQIRKLSKKGGAMILSYASTLDVFSRYFEKYGMDEAKGCKIYGVVSGSEMLKDATRATISKAFNCIVVSRYANEENGFIGQDGIQDNLFLHNRANYYIEILKFDSDSPVEKGEIGRIVITDLFNYSMPMVRYDTGDVGTWQEICVNGTIRKAIGQFGGRRVDMIYDCRGNIISPHAITNYMWKYNNMVNQFQLVQTGTGRYILKLTAAGTCNAQQIVSGLYNIVGDGADISVEMCDEIPVLASGKRKYIVNMMKQTSL